MKLLPLLLLTLCLLSPTFSIYTKKYVKAKSEYLRRLYSKKENIAVSPITSTCRPLQLQNPSALENTIMKSGYMQVSGKKLIQNSKIFIILLAAAGSALWYVFIGK